MHTYITFTGQETRMSGMPLPRIFEKLAEEIEVTHNAENAHFIDVIPAQNRYKNDAEPIRELNGIGETYADRLTNAGVSDSHALADTPVAELARIASVSEKQAERWVEQVPEATIYDNDDVWMTVMVIPGGADTGTIIQFIDAITGVNAPFDGNTVRFYLMNEAPESEAAKTDPEMLHAKEIDVITNAIKTYFDTPLSETPYAPTTN